MPTRFTEVHISSTVSSVSLRAKDHLEGTKVAVFPRNCAEGKVQTGSAAAGGHRRVATRKTTGDLTTRRGAGDPARRAEWMTVSRYGHLRSAPVVVDACVRTEWEPPTLRAALSVSTRPPRRLLDASCLSIDSLVRLHCHRLHATPSGKVQKFVRDAHCRAPKNPCDRRIQKFPSGESSTLLW